MRPKKNTKTYSDEELRKQDEHVENWRRQRIQPVLSQILNESGQIDPEKLAEVLLDLREDVNNLEDWRYS